LLSNKRQKINETVKQKLLKIAHKNPFMFSHQSVLSPLFKSATFDFVPTHL